MQQNALIVSDVPGLRVLMDEKVQNASPTIRYKKEESEINQASLSIRSSYKLKISPKNELPQRLNNVFFNLVRDRCGVSLSQPANRTSETLENNSELLKFRLDVQKLKKTLTYTSV